MAWLIAPAYSKQQNIQNTKILNNTNIFIAPKYSITPTYSIIHSTEILIAPKADDLILAFFSQFTLSTPSFQGPGIFFVIPCVDSYNKVDLRTVSFDVPPQEVREAGQRRHLFTFR